MSSTIPPFLCSTPPPIDFDETINDNEDDFGSFEANDSEYGAYNDDSESLEKTKIKTNDNLELPLPHETNFSLFLNKNQNENAKDIHKNEIKKDENNITEKFVIENSDIEISTENDSITKINDSNYSNKNNDKQQINNYLNNYETEDEIINQITNNLDNYLNVIDSSPQKIRDGSPQSLELNCNLSADEDNYSIGDFQNADIVNKYDDNTSLPSLKFDPVVDTQQILKSDTPIFGDNQSSLSSSVILKNQQELINEKITTESPPLSSSSSSSPQEDTLNFSAFETGNTEEFYNNENVDPNTSSKKVNFNEDNGDDESDKDNTSSETNTENFKSSNNHINDEAHNGVIESNDDNKSCDDNDNSDNEFDAFETFTCNRTQTNVLQKSLEDSVVFNSNDVSNTFEADFSQFEAFNENNHSNLPLENNNDIEVETEIQQIKQNEFKDFHDNYEKQIKNDLENKKNDENKEEDVDDDDDDFGEFSEFSDFKVATKSEEIETEEFPSLTNLQDKLKSVIDMMFPSVTNTECSINADNENYQRNEDNFNKFETNINDIDSAKALEYQWLQSNTKHSLIKALGIDSRNILYGEKWNSNMPRFAANLAFSPLEPLKPVKITSENHLTTKTKEKVLENKSKTDIPAVEFDWNSSGLINPLDASHAHTLLLDLDQLVVVANLDRLKFESSSSSPCSPFSTITTTTTTTTTMLTTPKTTVNNNTTVISTTSSTTTTATAINNEHHHLIYNNVSFDATDTATTSSADIIFSSKLDQIHSNKYNCSSTTTLSSSMMEIFNEDISNLINNHNIIIDDINHDDLKNLKFSHYGDVILLNGDGLNNFYATTSTNSNNISSINAKNNIDCLTNIATTKITENFNDNFFNQYLDCRIKEILQERKMDTIHSTESNSDNQSIKIEQQQQQQQTNETSNKSIEASTNTITFVSDINDDITTIPLPKSSDTQQSSLSSSSSTNVKDFQLENINNQLNYTENSLNKNNLMEETQHHHQYTHQHHNQQQQQQHHKTIYPLPLKETHIFTQDNKSKSISINKEINNDDNDKKCSIDFDYEMAAAGIIINENVVKKEYRDIEYNPRKLKTTTHIYDIDDNDDDGDNHQEFQTTSTTTMDCCNHECDKKNIKIYNEEENFDNKNEITINVIENKQNINSKELLNFPKSSTVTDLTNITVFTNNSINTSNNFYNLEKTNNLERNDNKFPLNKNDKKDEGGDDDFTEFQYAPPPQQQQPSLSQQSSINLVPFNVTNITNDVKQHQQTNKKSSQLAQNDITSRPSNVVIDEMILSPAVLLPKTIEIENHEPKINWPEPGINPEELERLEKIFPQPKSSFQQPLSTDLPFSGDKSKNDNDDDDDWSDFISVQPTSNIKTISPIKSNTKILCHQQQEQQQQQKHITVNNLSQFDDEWSDFCYVSAPPTSSSISPQFHHPSSSSKIACVSDSFSGIINSTTQQTTWQQLSQNQFLQSLTTPTAAATTTTVPISQYYQGNFIKNINNGTNKINTIQQQQQQNLLNGFSTTIPNHKMYFNEQTMPSDYNSSNNISPINQQQQYHHHHHHHHHHLQQQQQNKILIKNSNSMSLIPDLTFATPKNLINSSSKSNIPKK